MQYLVALQYIEIYLLQINIYFLLQFQFADKWDVLSMIFGTIFAMGNGVAQPCSFLVFGELIGKFIDYAKNINSNLPPLNIEEEMEKFAGYYCYIALGTIVCGYVQTAFWSLAAVRQCHRIRTNCFRSIMQQEIGWFDTTDTGELSTRLAE